MSVRYALLGLLEQAPRHGYDLHAAFEALVGGAENWDVKPAQVYTTLGRLAKAGLVAEEGVQKEGGPERHVYAITPAGRKALGAWFTTGVIGEHLRDEFFIKLMLSLAAGEDLARRVIQVQRATLYRELHRVTAQRQRVDPQRELAHVLLLDKAVMHLEADLHWLDMVETRLEEIQEQPLPQPVPKPRGRPRKQRKR